MPACGRCRQPIRVSVFGGILLAFASGAAAQPGVEFDKPRTDELAVLLKGRRR